MSDSSSESDTQQKPKVQAKKEKNSFNPEFKVVAPDMSDLVGENKKLRRKLKQLSVRLDQEIQKAAENRLKHKNNSANNGHPASIESQSLELQNAYKMIERLQKAVKDYENKESYQISLKRILDLESIIRKKELEADEIKNQLKLTKRGIKEKQRHINELIENSKKSNNPTQDKDIIHRLKNKLKVVVAENEVLRKKELQKHEKMVKAERRIVEMEQEEETPIGREESLLKQLQEMKKKYAEAMKRLERQNVYVTKLHEKLDDAQSQSTIRQKGRKSQGDRSRSLEELPELKKKKISPTYDLLEHLPMPKKNIRMKRY